MKKWGNLFGCLTLLTVIWLTLAGTPAAMAATSWQTFKVTDTGGQKSAAPVVVDSNGTKHTAWVSGVGTTAPGTLYYASSSGQQVIATTADENSPPSIFVTGANDIYIAWVDKRHGPNGDGSGWDIYYATSADNWANHLVTAGPTVACYNPMIAVGADGNIHISFTRFTTPGGQLPYNDQLFYVNKFGNWAETRVSQTQYSRIRSADMALAPDGTVHLTFSNDTVGGDPDGINHIYYASSSTGWLNQQIDSNSTSNWWDDRSAPVIAVGPDNVVHIAWEDARNTDTMYTGQTPNRIEIYYANSASGWLNTEIAAPADGGLTVKKNPSLTVDPSGLVHLAWLQKNSPDYGVVANLYYGNATDWQSAERVTDLANDTICPAPPDTGMCSTPVNLALHRHALVIDNGKPAILWQGIDSRGAELYLSVKETSSVIIDTFSLPQGAVGNNYFTSLTVSGGMPPYNWVVTNLPGGLVYDPSGTISGMPSTPGGYLVTLSVTDSYGIRADRSVSLIVTGQAAGNWTIYSVDPSGPSRIDWPTYQHGTLATGNYLRINGVFYYVAYSNYSSPWNGIAYNWADLQQCDQQTGAVLLDMYNNPLWANLTGTAGQAIELFTSWPAQQPGAWVVNSAYPTPPPYAIDWFTTQHGAVPTGSYLKIDGTYYKVVASGSGSWTGPDFTGAELAPCDQTTGIQNGTSVDVAALLNKNIELYTTWPGTWTVASTDQIAGVDWPSSQHGAVAVGNYLKIGGVYYYVIWAGTGTHWPGSDPGYPFAILQQCDQLTGQPLTSWNSSTQTNDPLYATFGTSYVGQAITLYPTWSEVPTSELPPAPVAVDSSTNQQGEPSINDLGEVVWAEYIGNNRQIFSNIRGQLTYDAVDHNSPAINNLGDVVWSDYVWDEMQLHGIYSIKGLIAGQQVVIASNDQFSYQVGGISDRGEVIWSQYGYGSSQIYSSTRGQLTFGSTYLGSATINSQGDIAWTQWDEVSGFNQVYKLAAGASVPVAATQDTRNYNDVAINNSGEIVWPDYGTGYNRIFSTTRGQLTFNVPDGYHNAPALNNCGDVVFTAYGTGAENVYRLGQSAPCGSVATNNDTPAQATPVSLGSTITATIDAAVSGEDWYRFDLLAGQTVNVRVNFADIPPNMLTMDLYDFNGQPVTIQPGRTPQQFSYTATASGTYFLRLKSTTGRFGYGLALTSPNNPWVVTQYTQTSTTSWDVVQWQSSAHGPVNSGDYLRIDGVYYYVQNGAPIYAGPGLLSAALANCDQNDGTVFGPANVNDSILGKLIELAAPPNLRYTIVATAAAGGTINPAGAVTVVPHADQQFIFTADPGYVVTNVIVNGYSVGPVNSFLMANVTGNGTIAVTFAQLPANDSCTNARIITGTSYSHNVDTSAATTGSDEPNATCGSGSKEKSVWYRFVAPANGSITVNTFGSSYDTILMSLTGSCGSFTTNWTCNDDYGGLQSFVNRDVIAGTTYYFMVSSYGNYGGTLNFNFSYTPVQYQLTVTKNGNGFGSVTHGDPPSYIMPTPATSGSANFPAGTPVTLTATPDATSVFTGWGGACTGITGSSCTVTMDGVRDVTAEFGKKTFVISSYVGGGGGGTLTPTTSVIIGDNQTFTATPDPGYSVQRVRIDGVDLPGPFTAPYSYTFTNVSTSHSITVNFVANPVISVYIGAGGGGSVSPSTSSLVYGGSQTFTATPDSGYFVQRVRIDGVDQTGPFTAPYNYTFTNVTGPHSITVNFASNPVISVFVAAGGGGTVTPSTTGVTYGGSQTFTASADPGYTVKLVKIDNVALPGPFTSPYNYTFDNVTGPRSIYVQFVANPIITSYIGAGGGGIVTPTQAVVYGGNQTFTATPNAGYSVQRIRIDGVDLPGPFTAPFNYSFTNVTAPHSITVNFILNPVISVYIGAGGGGTVTPSTSGVVYGGNQTFIATPDAGYSIQRIRIDGVDLQGPFTAPYSYTFTNVTAPHNITVNFTPNPLISVYVGAGGLGTVIPSTSGVSYGGSQTFTATPNAGYYVQRVRIDGVDQVGPFTAPYSYTFTNVTAPHSITVNFAPNPVISVYIGGGGGGTVTPSTTGVTYGGSQAFTATPDAGYYVKRVRIDGVDQVGPFTAPYNYTFTNVTAPHSITVNFARQ